MVLLADSDAVHDIRQILPQHQSALTLLNGKLQNPSVKLPINCGLAGQSRIGKRNLWGI